MQKLNFPGMKSLEQLKSSLSGPISGSAKTFSFSSRPSSELSSSGSFANLKLTAEKLVKEQASVKTDLEMANAKLKKSMEHIRTLEDKLQNAFNENAKLKVKQKEDEKLWGGLESKFSSTKTLCDQLTETLQHLAGQVQNAEKDKEFFEGKLSACSDSIDELFQQLNSLSLKLGSAEETIGAREKEIEDLKIEKEERNKFYVEEQSRTANLIEEKDAMCKKFEGTIEANQLATDDLNSQLEELHLKLGAKEDEIKLLVATQENLEKENSDLQLSSSDFANKLAISLQEIKSLEDFIHVLATQLTELDRQSLSFLDKFDHINSLNGSCFKLVQQQRDLAAKQAEKQYEQLHGQLLSIKSEKDALELLNQELNNKIIELQKAQETITEQFSEECRSAGERIQKLESEAEVIISKKNEAELVVSKLEGQIGAFLESSKSSENKMQELLLKISAIEKEKKHTEERLQAEIQKRAEEFDTLQKDCSAIQQRADSLKNQLDQLNITLEEKEQLILRYKDGEKKLEDQKSESQALLAAAESKLAEAKKQYDMMLESKQLELSRHLKEISQRNDQAINDIQKKYEVEKLQIVSAEKEKADKAILDIERKCDQKLAECKEEFKQELMLVQDEHAALVSGIRQEYDRREMDLKADHVEELKRAQIQAENEFREKIVQLRNEHEIQMRALKCELEDECRKLQEELDLQKSKEDRQRALLQLQWKVMGNKRQEEQEVNSKKEHSISSIKMRDPGGVKRSHHALASPENEDKMDSQYLRATQTPVSKLLKKVENVQPGSVMSIPKHHKKVTHREYEVETTNGRTITKHRKTRSTVMFEDPRKRKKVNTPKATTPSVVKRAKAGGQMQRAKAGGQSHPSNIGDLFSEGSLNPYADDPYAFD